MTCLDSCPLAKQALNLLAQEENLPVLDYWLGLLDHYMFQGNCPLCPKSEVSVNVGLREE